MHRTEPDHETTAYPSGISFIIGNEGCERFSFYGMRAILKIYILGLVVNHAGLVGVEAEARANEVYHLFKAAVYAFPMVGALLADRLAGKYATILWLSVVYCLGHLALAVFESPEVQRQLFGTVLLSPWDGLMLGLGLIAIGSGGIKPCVSAHVGDQFGRRNWDKLSSIYNAFYFIINFGSFFATLIIPVIRGELVIDPETGYYAYTGSVGWAFGVPGILMGLATIFFWGGRRRFVHVPARPGGLLGLLDVLAGTALFLVFAYPVFFSEMLPTTWWGDAAIVAACLLTALALLAVRARRELDAGGFLVPVLAGLFPRLLGPVTRPHAVEPTDSRFLGNIRARFGDDSADSTRAVLRVLGVFAMVSLFWALFDQHSSTWITQARDMDRVLDLSTAGWVATGAVTGLLFSAFALYLKRPFARRVVAALVFVAVGGGVALGGLSAGQVTLGESQIPALNPLMVMLLIPFTQKVLYPALARVGFEPHPLRRMTVGLYLAAASFLVIAAIQHAMDGRAPGAAGVPVAWQILPYLLITISEVMVSITGLEFGYSQAPKRMKSVIMGFWLLTVSAGNLFAGKVLGRIHLELFDFFLLFGGLMAIAGLAFHAIAARYRYRDVTQ
jgi:POT family proton-dependent oligopeptide transporter